MLPSGAMSKQPQDNAFEQFILMYHRRPVEFAENVLGMTPDKQQAQVMEDVAAGERRISVRSGHGTGKSTTIAMLACWFACTRIRFKVVMTAPTAPQLYDALWAETRSFFRALPAALRGLFEIKADRIELKLAPEEGFVTVRTSSKERPEALAGIHADHVLLVADEASAVPEEVFESAVGSMSGDNACMILTGNPTRLTGLFYRTHHDLRGEWKTHHWSSIKSPRVDKRFIKQILDTYGEESNQYRVRVLGDFPLSEDETLIRRKTVEDAVQRDYEVDPEVKRYWGLDPARFGADVTALVERQGGSINWIKQKSGADTMNVAGWVKFLYDELPMEERPRVILVDSIGVGAGIVDRLRELKLPVRGVDVSMSSLVTSSGSRLRDQLWLDMKAWLESGQAKLPDDRGLVEELVSVQYSFMSNGKLKMESKQEMKRRGVRSPNKADAVALTFAEDPATLASGPAGFSNGPIRRNLRGYG